MLAAERGVPGRALRDQRRDDHSARGARARHRDRRASPPRAPPARRARHARPPRVVEGASASAASTRRCAARWCARCCTATATTARAPARARAGLHAGARDASGARSSGRVPKGLVRPVYGEPEPQMTQPPKQRKDGFAGASNRPSTPPRSASRTSPAGSPGALPGGRHTAASARARRSCRTTPERDVERRFSEGIEESPTSE